MPIVSEQERQALRKYEKRHARKGKSRRERSRARGRRTFLVLLLLTVLGVLSAAALIIFFLDKPAVMPADTALDISHAQDDAIEFRWTPANFTSGYRLAIYDAGEGGDAKNPLIDRFCKSADCTLKAAELFSLAKNRPMRVEITARDFFFFLKRPSEDGREVPRESQAEFICYLCDPEIRNQQGSIDVEHQSVTVGWSGWDGDSYALYLASADGNRVLLKELGGSGGSAGELSLKDYEVVIPYGAGWDFSIPQDDGKYTLEIEVKRDNGQVSFPGHTEEVAQLTRADLLSRVVTVQYDRLENNRYRLRWNDTGSLAYRVEIQRPGSGDFEELAVIGGRQETVYETKEHLKACREYTFRVTGITDGDELVGDQIDAKFSDPFEGAEETAQTAEMEVTRSEDDNVGEVSVFTEPSTLYASIWPTKKLDLYRDTDKKEITASAQPGQCLCVLEEIREKNLFRVRIGDHEGYIDSNYCMINLPDYLGELCQYDIPNSYASIYMVNDYYIPNVTAQVIPGYEDVLLDDDTFLVPLLYPVAIRLLDAAQSLYEDGYRIEINDSFRPHCATRYIYDETNKVLYWQLPENKFWPERTSFAQYLRNGHAIGELDDSVRPAQELEELARLEAEEAGETLEQGEPAEGQAGPDWPTEDLSAQGEGAGQTTGDGQAAAAEGAGGVPADSAAEGETPADGEGPLLEDTEENRNTYYWEMTSGSYKLGSFLAAAASRHNLGVAMDMTIVSLSDPAHPLEMQTQMHNLSHYSAMGRNNANADILKEYLTKAGFAMISSEWWHFQDDDATKLLGPPILENGVCIEGWKKDDTGWKYLDKKGNAVRDQKLSVDGKDYVFDSRGYTER